METLQPGSRSHLRLPLHQRQVWPIQMPHDWLLCGMCVFVVVYKCPQGFICDVRYS